MSEEDFVSAIKNLLNTRFARKEISQVNIFCKDGIYFYFKDGDFFSLSISEEDSSNFLFYGDHRISEGMYLTSFELRQVISVSPRIECIHVCLSFFFDKIIRKFNLKVYFKALKAERNLEFTYGSLFTGETYQLKMRF